jgi:hypothetical protein
MERNFYRPMTEARITIATPPFVELIDLLSFFAEAAATHAIRVATCCEPAFTDSVSGVAPHRCIDVDRLIDCGADRSRIVTVKKVATRPGCGCYYAKEIGAYDSCPTGCVYCYANRSREYARQRWAAHDPSNPLLG